MRRTRTITVLAAAGVARRRRRRVRQRRQQRAAAAGAATSAARSRIDGSSTVLPFAQAAAELFNQDNPDVKITVGSSGTGGGFEKFCAGETDISDASRPIKPDEEAPSARRRASPTSEVQVANDGIAVVTNKDLKIDCLTIAQLKKLWNKGSKVKTYSRDRPAASRTAGQALRPRHGLGHVRLLHRRDQRRGGRVRARTTSRPRTTTCSSRASRATRAASATSASPTTRAQPGQAQPGRRRRRRAAASRRARRRSRTAATSRSPARCSCTRARSPSREPAGQGFMDFVVPTRRRSRRRRRSSR